MASIRDHLSRSALAEPARSHARALYHRAAEAGGPTLGADSPEVWAAAFEYLAVHVDDPAPEVAGFASARQTEPSRVFAVLADAREASRFRAYVGEWIRAGRQLDVVEEPLEASDEDIAGELVIAPPEAEPEAATAAVEPADGAPAGPPVAAPPLPGEPAGTAPLPAIWRAPHPLYHWQEEAARAWIAHQGRGIVQVVTGAGKTLLGVYLFARLREYVSADGRDVQAIIVVPRVALIDQWRHAIRQVLDTTDIRIGAYHSGERCFPNAQDILIITQDSARTLLPRMRFERPTLLIADECHRLGAPGAARIFQNNYNWRLGLSATPDRSSDFGFEEVLVPNLGPIIYRYGYAEAVRDGIISPFVLARVSVPLTPAERAEYDDLSTKITRLNQALRSDYHELRRARDRRTFFKILGALRQRHRDDERFDQFKALLTNRREIVHTAEGKLDAIKLIASKRSTDRRGLCFHERIEWADRLKSVIEAAGCVVCTYHSRLDEGIRKEHLARFRRGDVDWLVACRALDEGLDVPQVDTVIIAAGATVPRQIIQRLGRALRRRPEKAEAEVILLEVAGIDEHILAQDELADLRGAAEAVVELDLSTLGAWLDRSAPAGQAAGAKPAAVHRAVGAALAVVRAAASHVGQRYLGLRPAPSSWTGTSGTKSYYDKDSSPE